MGNTYCTGVRLTSVIYTLTDYGINSDRLRTAALALTGYLDSVRREAMAKSVTCTIAVSNAAVVSASPSPSCGVLTADLREEAGSNSITISSPTGSSIGFTPQGTSSSSAAKEFILSLPGHGVELCVKVYTPLGFIRQGDRAVGGSCNYSGV